MRVCSPLALASVILALAPAPLQARRRASLSGVGPRADHCGFVKVATRLRDRQQGQPIAVTLPAGEAVKILEVEGGWLRVGKLSRGQGCFAKPAVAAAGWLKRGRLSKIYLLASERRKGAVGLSRGRPLYRFNREEMVLKAFGKSSPTLDDEGGQGFRVWTTGLRRYPFAFHTLGWDMGPGSLTLFGPRGMLSLTSPGTRFTAHVVGGAFRVTTDHLCLQLGLGLRLEQVIKRKGWPRRFEVLQVALRGAKQGQVRQLHLGAAKITRRKLPVVGVDLTARDAQRPGRQLKVTRGTYFRPRALILGKRGSETAPTLEVELLPGKRRVLLRQQQLVKTTLLVHCAG